MGDSLSGCQRKRWTGPMRILFGLVVSTGFACGEASLGIGTPRKADGALIEMPVAGDFPDVSGQRVIWHSDYTLPERLPMILSYDIRTQEVDTLEVFRERSLLSSPKIDGDHVAWIQDTAGVHQIGFLNLSTGAEVRLDGPVRNPRSYWTNSISVSRRGVVWLSPERQVLFYDFELGATTHITDDSLQHYDVDTDGSLVVWRQRGTDPSNVAIVWRDIDTDSGGSIEVSEGAAVIGGVWLAYSTMRSSSGDLRLRNLETGQEQLIDGATPIGDELDMDGSVLVWLDRRDGTPGDMYLYEADTRLQLRLTDHPDEEVRPAVSDRYVVWKRATELGPRVFLLRLDD